MSTIIIEQISDRVGDDSPEGQMAHTANEARRFSSFFVFFPLIAHDKISQLMRWIDSLGTSRRMHV